MARWRPCCCLPNCLGATLVGILSLIGSTLWLSYLVNALLTWYNYYSEDHEYYQGYKTETIGVVLLIYLVVTFISVLTCLLLLVGVAAKSTYLIKPWIIYAIFLFIIEVILFFLRIYAYHITGTWALVWILGFILGASLTTYFIFVVFAYHDELNVRY